MALMGPNASSDEWCSRSDVVIEGLPWTRKIVDDILVWAETEEELMESYPQQVQRAQHNNIQKEAGIGNKIRLCRTHRLTKWHQARRRKVQSHKRIPRTQKPQRLDIIPKSGKSISSICTRSSSQVCRPQAVAKERKCMGVGKST